VSPNSDEIDVRQVSRWFDEYARPMVLYARQWVATGDADDVVQDVFATVVRQKIVPDDIAAWLYRAVRNAAISRSRSNRRRRRREAEHARPWFETGPDDLIDAATATRQLMRLPPEQREIVILRIWADLSFGQIGRVLDVSQATAFRHYNDALKQVRQRLEPSCTNKKTT
jgi:RNA polymerase sigma-70 factor (ECF subfamily)